MMSCNKPVTRNPVLRLMGGANKTSLGSVGNLTGIDDRIRDALLENELEKLVNGQKYEMECDLADGKMSNPSDPIKIDMDVDNNSNVFEDPTPNIMTDQNA